MSNATLPTRTGGIRRRNWFIGQSVTAYTPLAKSNTMPLGRHSGANMRTQSKSMRNSIAM
ncbi:Uncharacterised protein [Mycobacterium tuberculosis]|nr:Uncharacterised protein [Mycobacterium tuberculosis]